MSPMHFWHVVKTGIRNSSTNMNISLTERKTWQALAFHYEQIKNHHLRELFATDEGKYKWFDAVYPHVSDTGNFPLLGELIKDEYFLNRFKAMIRH